MIPRRLRVLIVEDTPASRKLLATVLGKRGYQVDLAENGEEAVQMVHERDYDVVLMDVQMPIMDGLQATALIRRLTEPAKSHLPIVAVTAFAQRGQRELCLAAGMNDFITKPVDLPVLVNVVERFASSAV